MKINTSKKIIFAFLFCLVASKSFAQETKTITVDPNQLKGMVPIDRTRDLKNQILIWNSYSIQIAVLFSKDKAKWDTVLIDKKDGKIFKAPRQFARIYTADNYKECELTENNPYVIIWDKQKKNWDIKLFKQ